MRRLPARPLLDPLNNAVHRDFLRRMVERTAEILQVPDGAARIELARQIYTSSRTTQWFRPIIEILRELSGPGEFCMYCSANEPSQVEHFRPIGSYPLNALSFNNYLWSCDICNRSHKGEKFPPITEPGAEILNPLDDDVWRYFFIDDQFGQLVARIDPNTNARMPRAVSTCEVVGIDRESVQFRRRRRYVALRKDVRRTLNDLQTGLLTVEEVRDNIADWRSDPFQLDVADFFLNGPGRTREPFRTLLLAVGEAIPT